MQIAGVAGVSHGCEEPQLDFELESIGRLNLLSGEKPGQSLLSPRSCLRNDLLLKYGARVLLNDK